MSLIWSRLWRVDKATNPFINLLSWADYFDSLQHVRHSGWHMIH